MPQRSLRVLMGLKSEGVEPTLILWALVRGAPATTCFSSRRRRRPAMPQRSLRVLMGLKSEGVEPTLILWALVRELRGLWQARERARLRSQSAGSGWNQAAKPSERALSRIGKMPLARLLRQAGQTDRIIKGSGARRCVDRHHRVDRLHGRRFASVSRFRQGSLMNPMGIFGGTFDPIHYAHLRTAFELQQALRLKEIRFLPAGNPPHRDQPVADAQLRLKMVAVGDRRSAGFRGRRSRSAQAGAVLLRRDLERTSSRVSGPQPMSHRRHGCLPELAQMASVAGSAAAGSSGGGPPAGMAGAGDGAVGRITGRSRHRAHRRPARTACRLHLSSMP